MGVSLPQDDEILQNKNAVFNLMDLKVYDEYTFYHSVNVAVLSIIVATELGLSKEELIKLGISGLLHDIGKVFVKKEILNKKGKLSESEFREIKEHPVNGFNYLKKSCQIPLKSYVGVLQHHEKYDGTGYPYGLKGREISLFGRILTIADIYDALISDRPYRQGILPSEAMEYIMGGGGTYFDPEISTVFVKKLALYPVGTCVELSNGMIGIVCQNYEGYSIRPDIKVFQNKDRKIKPFILKLQKQINITITSVVKNDILAAMWKRKG